MIQVNLIPDVKQAYYRAERIKRLIMLVAFLASAGFAALTVLLFLWVNVVQKAHTNSLQEDIDSLNSQVRNAKDFDKILTVQNQLISLSQLHKDKPQVTRIDDFLSVLIPNEISISTIDVEIENTTINIAGTGETDKDVNILVDVLKNAFYTVADDDEKQQIPAFDNVVLQAFGVTDESDEVPYSLTMSYDPTLFDSETDVTMRVPNIISTRSEVERPKPLFDNAVDEVEE